MSKGKLLLCSIDLRTNLENRPVARQMIHSLLGYMDSPGFDPAHKLDPNLIHALFREPPLLSRLKSVTADSHHPDHPPQNAFDGRADTIWHTHWENNPPDYPHEIRIELPEPIEIKGLKYLPRQDMSNGWISKYQIYLSDNPDNWGDPVATGTLPRGRAKMKIMFESQKARFIRFVALEGIDNQIFASIAELNIIPPEEMW